MQAVAVCGYENYLATRSGTQTSPGMFLWYNDMIHRSPKSSYQLAAGSCAVEAALHPAADYGLKERRELIARAVTHWESAYEKDAEATNDIAERAKWAICQVPTFNAIATFIERGQVSHVNKPQEQAFVTHFTHLLNRWPHEELSGHALEALTSYSLHRSNRMRPNESPLYALPACVRDDYHPDSKRRVDVDVYDLNWAMKYGIQVKAGKMTNPHANDPLLHRIFVKNARRLLCLPKSKRHIERTLEAIVTDDPRYRDDLDTIAADMRARVKRCFAEPRYIGTPIRRRRPLRSTRIQ